MPGRRRVRIERPFAVRQNFLSSVSLSTFLLLAAVPTWAQVNLGPVTVGAGLQTSSPSTTTNAAPHTANEFLLNSARIYINGPVTENIGFMFNTEYDGATNKIGIL